MSEFLAIVVEDDFDLAEIFTTIFHIKGLAAEMVMDGRLAMETIRTRKPDVVLLDMHLPHVSGLEILGEIRADAELYQTKVVVITADVLRMDGFEEQVELVLVKPVSFAEMNAVIDWLVG